MKPGRPPPRKPSRVPPGPGSKSPAKVKRKALPRQTSFSKKKKKRAPLPPDRQQRVMSVSGMEGIGNRPTPQRPPPRARFGSIRGTKALERSASASTGIAAPQTSEGQIRANILSSSGFTMTKSNLEQAKVSSGSREIDLRSDYSDDSSGSLGVAVQNALSIQNTGGAMVSDPVTNNEAIRKSKIMIDGNMIDLAEVQKIAKELDIIKSEEVTFNEKVTKENVGMLADINPGILNLTISPSSGISVTNIPLILKKYLELIILDVTGCKTFFTSWDKLKGEDETNFKEEMKKQQAAVRAISKHGKLGKVVLKDMQFMSEKAMNILLESKSIQYFDFSHCHHFGDQQMSKCGNLLVLVVNHTGITDKGIKKLASACKTTLQGLSIRSCDSLTAKCILNLADFPVLSELDISANTKLNANYRSLISLTSLESINISSLPIQDSDLAVFSRITTLKTLIMESCPNITSTGLNAAASSGLSHFLVELNIQNCPKVDSLSFLQNFQSLRSLNAKNISFDPSDFARNVSTSTLEQIFFSRATDTHLRAVSTLPLSHLEANDSEEVTNAGFRFVALNNRLKWVKIDSKQITVDALTKFEGIHVINFAVMKYLAEKHRGKLNLSDNESLEPLVVANITFFKYIRELNLENCYMVNDDVIRTFVLNPSFKYVRRICIKGTQVSRNVFRGNRIEIPKSILRAVVEHTNSLDFTESLIVNDDLVAELVKWPELHWLNLTGCKRISNATLEALMSIPEEDFHLKMLMIFNTSISPDAVRFALSGRDNRTNKVLLRSLVSTGLVDIFNLPDLDAELFSDVLFNCYLPTIDLRRVTPEIRGILSPLRVTSTVQHLNLAGLTEIQDSDVKELFGPNSPRLLTLYIDECNQITNAGIIAVSSSVTLVNLSLRGLPEVTDYGAKYLARIPTLTQLNISDNLGLGDETVRSVSYCKKLTKISFSNTTVTKNCFYEPLQFDPAPAVLEEFISHFHTLIFNGWTIDFDQVLEFSVGNATIDQITFTNCAQLSDYFIGKIIGSYSALRYADLSGCTSISNITLPRPMTTLKLRGCWAINNTPQGIAKLFSHDMLVYLDLNDIGFDSNQLFQVLHPNIITLLVRGIMMRPQDMRQFAKFFPNVKELDISKIDVPAGNYFPNLLHNRSLESLTLNSTSIGDADFDNIAEDIDPIIEYFSIDGVHITYKCLVVIKERMTRLKTLSMKNYEGAGQIPGKIFKTWELEEIDLSSSSTMTDSKLKEMVKFQQNSSVGMTRINCENCERVSSTFDELVE